MSSPSATSIAQLLERHDGVLLDAYGVLVDAGGALPHAPALIAELVRRTFPFAVVTNDASRSVDTYVARFAAMGMAIPGERIITSGSLLPAWIRERDLAGKRVAVLGTPDSEAFVVEGGGVLVTIERGMEIDAVAICDDAGTPFLDGIELVLSAAIRAMEAGRRPALVVPNPDIVYPKGGGELGFTAGAMALLVETALQRRFPTANLIFERLGKPMPALFTEGARRIGATNAVMIGDQLETDIAGALGAGLSAALLAGVSTWSASAAESLATSSAPITPTYLLADLSLG
ncbi:MAG TPA: HAD hydrolase-like protein [Kofleriaceae bacterium]|jgi:HAD superfamily hydrolase (TIGR01450 family)